VALAYSRLREYEKSDEAMMLIGAHFENMASQGIDNLFFSSSRAGYYAMEGDLDAAFTHLQTAVDNGFVTIGDPAIIVPELQALADDPRFAAIEAAMLNTTNRNRAMVGLPPFDSDYQIPAESETL